VADTSNFLRQIVEEDLRTGRHQQVVTRFPPEPNGYLHIGHAKAISIDFGLPSEYGGRCHLRMDDTNPLKESEEYVLGIQRDLRWLGYDWGEHLYYASDYFEQLFEWAKLLVNKGLAYVDEHSEEQIRENRGTVESPGTPSPWRERPAAESLALLDRMARGDFPDGAMVLRAKIDLGHVNMKMRDPVMYRIRNVPHHRTGDRWHIYPLYDWAHGQSDAIEGITHSLCSLEFDVNRELYDWFIDNLPVPARPRQYEFARLNLTYTMMSKRNLLSLVEEGLVTGWDDPRMPTIAGLRRRGYTPASIRSFAVGVGVSKANSIVDPVVLENAVRDDLNDKAPRVMVVIDPLRLELVGEPADAVEDLDASYWPHDVDRQGSRPLPLSSVVLVEREDFAVSPAAGFKRLAPGRSVRLRHGPVVTYVAHEADPDGRVTVVRCARAAADVKVSATVHWVSAAQAVPVEVRLYDRLFSAPEPGKDRDFRLDLNPDSLKVVTGWGEPSLRGAAAGEHYQFERTGFFFVDPHDSTPAAPRFNRVVPLKDSWSKRADQRPEVAAEEGQPAAKTVRLLGALGDSLVAAGLSSDAANVLETDPPLHAWYVAALAVHPDAKAVSSWVVTELPRVAKERGGLSRLPFAGDVLGKLVALVESGGITAAAGKQVLGVLAESGGDPAQIVAERGWAALSDAGAIDALVDQVLAEFPDKVAAYRGGRTGLLGFLLGQVVQRSGGRADPLAVKAALQARLG
jgi:glutaminyl-tRNA synthetase